MTKEEEEEGKNILNWFKVSDYYLYIHQSSTSGKDKLLHIFFSLFLSRSLCVNNKKYTEREREKD